MTSIPTISVRIPRDQSGHKGTLSIAEWTVPCVVGSGGLVAASVKREGDRKTPIGTFPLRYGLFRPLPALRFLESVSFPFVPCSDDMIWEEDGPDYNKLVYADGADRMGERLARPRDHDLFNVIVPIGYNDAVPEAGRGSALFVHAARPDMSGTAGCVALRPDDLLELARRLKPGMLIDLDYDGAPPPGRPRERPGANRIRELRRSATRPAADRDRRGPWQRDLRAGGDRPRHRRLPLRENCDPARRSQLRSDRQRQGLARQH